MKYLEARKEDGKDPKPSVRDPQENKMQPGSRRDQMDPKRPETLVSSPRAGGKSTTGAPSAQVQKLATELKVDLSSVKGSGENGAITEEDVRKAQK